MLVGNELVATRDQGLYFGASTILAEERDALAERCSVNAPFVFLKASEEIVGYGQMYTDPKQIPALVEGTFMEHYDGPGIVAICYAVGVSPQFLAAVSEQFGSDSAESMRTRLVAEVVSHCKALGKDCVVYDAVMEPGGVSTKDSAPYVANGFKDSGMRTSYGPPGEMVTAAHMICSITK